MRRGKTAKPVQFYFDATQRSGLSDQMADGLRQAILTGRYAPGETLPTILEWAKMLGVSIRVPEAAIARLVAEGLIVARRRYGCVVAERGNRPSWRGHVLIVVPDDDVCYYSNALQGCVRTRLSAAGYLVSTITVRHGAGEEKRFEYDLAPLEFALRQTVDLVVLIFNYKRASIARTVARSGVPFVEFADASIKAQIGAPSMRIPIQYAFDYPNRSYSPKNRFSFLEHGCNLTFEKPDTKTFRCLQIAYDCMLKGGNAPCIMNAANEVAVDAFLKGRIGFMRIPEIIESTLEKLPFESKISIESCFATDKESRRVAEDLVAFNR